MCFDLLRFLIGPERRIALDAQPDVARLVRELRERTGLTQEKFAAKLGVTFPTINRWENSRAKPSPLALKQIEDLLLDLGERGKDLLQEFFTGEKN
jgi:putative transcriptional regulator